MTLYEKVKAIYPELTLEDFNNRVIVLRDDSDSNDAYIDVWEHPTFARPTQEQLDAVSAE